MGERGNVKKIAWKMKVTQAAKLSIDLLRIAIIIHIHQWI